MKFLGSVVLATVLASLAFAAPIGAAPLLTNSAVQVSTAADPLLVEVAIKKKIVYKKKKVVIIRRPVVVVPVGPQCVARVEREGSQNVIKSIAENSARTAWGRAVRSIYGERYLDLGLARNGSLTCVKSSTGLFKLTRCTFAADPCKPAGQ
jgi:hypothetical protein